MVPFENDLEVLEVHSKISIHALPNTNNYVIDFKQLTRKQIDFVQNEESSSIIILEEPQTHLDDRMKSLIVDLTLEEETMKG